MPTNSSYLKAIREAWGAMEPWMQKDFPVAVMKYVPPDVTVYGDYYTFYDQKVSRFDGVGRGTVVDVLDRPNIRLRIAFAVLEVSGKVRSAAFRFGPPTYTLTVQHGLLDWDADPGPPLTINALSVVGERSAKVEIGSTQVSQFGGPDPGWSIEQSVKERQNDVFESSRFLMDVTAILHRKILEVSPGP